MTLMRWAGTVIAAIMLSGCATSKHVTPYGNISPATYCTAALVPYVGNSPELDGYIREALAAHGIALLASKPPGTTKADDVGLLVKYHARWGVDWFFTFLSLLHIDLFDARSGTKLMTGIWKNSFLHGFQRGTGEAKELIDDMIPQIRGVAKQDGL
jgi:hypothetical protein